MSRIEPQQAKIKKPHTVLKGIAHFLTFFIKLPCKVTLRLLVFGILVVLFVLVVRTGIWEIPVVSNILYREPNPLHQFDAEQFSSTLLLLKAEESLFQSSGSNASLSISEGELTSLVRKYTDTSHDTLSDVQVSISQEYIEVYGRVENKPQIVLRARVKPVVTEGDVEFVVHSIYIGQVPIPKGLLSSKVISWITPPLFESLIESVRVDAIELEEQSLILTIYPS